jgi:uncharacterized protein (TIGR00369 family)
VQSRFASSNAPEGSPDSTLAQSVVGRPGIDWLRGVLAGTLPPPQLVADVGIALLRVEEGLVIGEYAVQERHLNGLDSLHGGLLATLADTAGSCAVLSVIPAGTVAPTLEMKINFLRPVPMSTGVVRLEGRLLSRGRTTALAEVRISDASERLLAFATVTCSIIPLAEEAVT